MSRDAFAQRTGTNARCVDNQPQLRVAVMQRSSMLEVELVC